MGTDETRIGRLGQALEERLVGYAFEAHDTLQHRFLEKVDQRVECKRMIL